MPLPILFWVLFVIWVVVGGWFYWSPPNYRPLGGHLLLALLIFILGVGTFGWIVK